MASDNTELQVLSDELSRVANIAAYASSTEIAIVAAQVVVHAGILTTIVTARTELQWAVWLLLPLVPYWITGFHMMHGARGTILGFYVRALERRIHHLSGSSLDLDEHTRLVAPSYSHLVHTTSSSRSAFPEQKALYVAGIAVMQSLLIGEAAYCILQVHDVRAQLLGTVIYSGLATLIFSYTIRITLRGPDLWKWTLRSMKSGWARGLGPNSPEPSRALMPSPHETNLTADRVPITALRYQVHPRPLPESLGKALLGFVIFGIALLPSGPLEEVWEVLHQRFFVLQAFWGLLYLLAFEFVVYPSRYYINDLADPARSIAPELRKSDRPLIGKELSVARVCLIAGLRFALGASLMLGIAHFRDFRDGGAFTNLIVLLLLTSTGIYELARRVFWKCHEIRLSSWMKFILYVFALWTGYALRGFVALTAGFGGPVDGWGDFLFAAGAGLLGCSTVILHISDVGAIFAETNPRSLHLRQQGHIQFLLKLRSAQRGPSRAGTAQFREALIPTRSVVFWIFLMTTPLLVVGSARILGETHTGSISILLIGMVLMQIVYLRMRRNPTMLWVPFLTTIAALLVSLVVNGWTYLDYLWVAAPVFATHAYFERFRDTPPAEIAGFGETRQRSE